VYELELDVNNATGRDATIAIQFASYPATLGPDEVEEYVRRLKKQGWEAPTRIWDGPVAVIIDGKTELKQVVTTPLEWGKPTPSAMRATLVTRKVLAGRDLKCRLRIPVPGLISIPAAIVIKATGAQAGAQKQDWWPVG
jgi:hypothetical protein